MTALEQLPRPGVQRRDFDALARRAVAAAISAGADGYRTDEQFWSQVRRVLGGGFYDARCVASECDYRLAKIAKTGRNGGMALPLRTLKEAAERRIA